MTAIICSRVNVPLPTWKLGITVMLPTSSYAAVVKAANKDVL